MSRLVEHDATAPAVIKVGDKMLGICMCGLSQSKPFCDGSHKKVADEKAGLVYIYDEHGHRVSLYNAYPTPTQVIEK